MSQLMVKMVSDRNDEWKEARMAATVIEVNCGSGGRRWRWK